MSLRVNHMLWFLLIAVALGEFAVDRAVVAQENAPTSGIAVTQDDNEIRVATSAIEAVVRKKGYVSGVYQGTFVDKKTGFRDVGFGLDVVDWLLEPGRDQAYRSKLNPELVNNYGDLFDGHIAKRGIEGPQICTRAKALATEIISGKDFAAVKEHFTYYIAAPGKKTGSRWTQTIVFLPGKRYFISSDRIDTVNASDAMFLRIDMPGHIKHHQGDTFSEVYLSYYGKSPSSEFFTDFPPDAKFIYRRDDSKIPQRIIRAYHLRDPKTGRPGPWLAGMTLDPKVVYQAWCHERGYVCMIEEVGGRPVKPGDSFGAAYIVGYFDSIEEMNNVYDEYAGNVGLHADANGWRLLRNLR